MHLLAIVESIDHVCCRYRLRAFEPYWQQAGHTLAYLPLPKSWWGRMQLGSAVRPADVVVLQRKLLSRLELRWLRRSAKTLIFDLDDAIWLRDSFSPKGFEHPKRSRRFQTTIQLADVVVGGNAYLADQASFFSANQPYIVPTCVDVEQYPQAMHFKKAVTQLVWVGSSSTLQGLEAFRTTFERIGSQIPDLELHLLCDRFLHFEYLPVRKTMWSESLEKQALAAADIGISWIPDDAWSRGKCGLKVLQYMAAGLPVIANPVGVHPEMIQHGVTGLLVRTEAEWLAAIRMLKDNPDLRQRMGQAARTLVEKKYSVPVGAEKWLTLLNDLQRKRISA